MHHWQYMEYYFFETMTFLLVHQVELWYVPQSVTRMYR
jgi:hypothetical protein